MKWKIFVAVVMLTTVMFSQQDTAQDSLRVINRLMYNNQSKLTIGGYVQIDYNEPDGVKPGNLDVHRLVLLFGYNFSDRVSFLTEIELEHVKEIYVEQAFVNYSFSTAFNLRGGLMLVPMGYVNEYHEPPVFFGTERPGLDKYVVPTTWRELGVGATGNLQDLSLKYQAYIFNGFISYKDGEGTLRGIDGLRGGRQKGAESVIHNPNLSVKFDYYGILGLKLGVAGYFGETQSDDPSVENSTVGVSMLGLNASYLYRDLTLRGQYVHTSLSGTEAYNNLTGKDLGSKIEGFYLEAAYNFLPLIDKNTTKQLSLFSRYEAYNTHAETTGDLDINEAYDRNNITLGLDFKIAPGVVVKADYQWFNDALQGSNPDDQFNAGVGVMF
jgi:hypothetical protein